MESLDPQERFVYASIQIEGSPWKGRGEPGSRQGSWHNENTGESLHPDLEHPPPKQPHWDYKGPNYPNGARLNIDGTWEVK